VRWIQFWLACFAIFYSPSHVLAGELQAPQDIEFKATLDGSSQRYLLRLSKDHDPKQPHDMLIALHGHGSDRHQGVSNRAEFQAPQDFAAKYDMIYISPDYRVNTSWMGPAAEADVVQIIADIKTQSKVKRVFLTGTSMGGSSALTFAALHPDLIAGVCSQNGTANHVEYQGFQDAIAASFGGTKEQIPEEYKNRSAELWPKKFTMPVAIAAGKQDDTVPPQSVVRLAQQLQRMQRDVLLIYHEDGGHSTSYDDTMAGLEFMLKKAKIAPQ